MNLNKKKYFITGIGTDVGKTIVSAVLVEALKADYWKPIQSGDLHHTDTDKVKALISNADSTFFPSTYAFKEPASPHYSAGLENVEIDLNAFQLPKTNNHLIVEGAGGLLVPLNKNYLMVDLIEQLGLETILVVRNYLGSINHTLLSIEALRSRKIALKGIIVSGSANASSEDYILEYTKVPFLGRIEEEQHFDKPTIQKYASQFQFLG